MTIKLYLDNTYLYQSAATVAKQDQMIEVHI